MPAHKSSKAPAKKAAKSPAPPAVSPAKGGAEKRRFWLNYPTCQITRPLIWELSQRFAVVFNIRQASVSDEIGILCLELEGSRQELKAVIAWLESEGVKVEPVEIGVIES